MSDNLIQQTINKVVETFSPKTINTNVQPEVEATEGKVIERDVTVEEQVEGILPPLSGIFYTGIESRSHFCSYDGKVATGVLKFFDADTLVWCKFSCEVCARKVIDAYVAKRNGDNISNSTTSS